jgi:Zn-dependent protease with chaperone function
MQRNGLSPCLLASMLEKLEAAHLAQTRHKHPDAELERRDEALDYLSSHPATQERITLLCPSASSR